jgi:glycine/D-amino acid oxidase-like deaminating enzyme
MKSRQIAPVAVLGAGIQGTCLALALARRGVGVDLYDGHPAPLMGASVHGEGKLHLGFVYANDPLGATHRLMVRGSLLFAPIVEALAGLSPAGLVPSSPFHYAVAADSLHDAERLESHYGAVAECIREQQRDCGGLYLGQPIREPFRRLSDSQLAARFDPASVSAVFETAERAVQTPRLAERLRRVLAEDQPIRFHGATEVLAARIESGLGVRLRLAQGGREREVLYPVAVNCLWDGRLALDASAGIVPERPWLFRYKASLGIRTGTPSAALPSATLVLGPYGDLVNFGNGDYYLSWYPSFKLGQTIDRGSTIRQGLAGMAAYVPGLDALAGPGCAHELGGGVIFAWGSTDIDDPGSGLHQRWAIGPECHGPYLSIDTGKYTMAPLFALQAAEQVCGLLDLGLGVPSPLPQEVAP